MGTGHKSPSEVMGTDARSVGADAPVLSSSPHGDGDTVHSWPWARNARAVLAGGWQRLSQVGP